MASRQARFTSSSLALVEVLSVNRPTVNQVRTPRSRIGHRVLLCVLFYSWVFSRHPGCSLALEEVLLHVHVLSVLSGCSHLVYGGSVYISSKTHPRPHRGRLSVDFDIVRYRISIELILNLDRISKKAAELISAGLCHLIISCNEDETIEYIEESIKWLKEINVDQPCPSKNHLFKAN